MKLALKLSEPPSLVAYRGVCPDSTWEQMRNDAEHGGQTVYREIKSALVRGQRCLCAFCETRIANGSADQDLEAKKNEQRVEHFHPKNDPQRPPNWNLHWPTMWVVCTGGDQWPPKGEALDPARHVHPRPENLSCDAFKNRQIETKQLNNPPEGWILSPEDVPAVPPLFEFSANGTPQPHVANCAAVAIPGNRHPDTQTLVAETIRHLNLGCNRLNRNRTLLRAKLEKEIGRRRKAYPGAPARSLLLQLARRIFPGAAVEPWPEFFTFVRWRLGAAAEARLLEINFAG